jgi:membrane-bound metal-dependent hydrolase YbcI (DUF457 family)
MDIYTHAASGAVTGMLFAVASGRAGLSRRAAILCCTFGAVMPDLDAVSFGLGAWGRRAYKGDHWYSHHQASHSLLGVVVLGLVVAAAWSWWRRRRDKPTALRQPVMAGCLSLGGVVHILGDLPTPAGPWGGLPVLFPLSERFGGWGHLWWFHNYYVLWVLLLALTCGDARALLERKRPRLRKLTTACQTLVAIVALTLVGVHIASSRFEPSGNYPADDIRAIQREAEWVPEPFYSGFVWASKTLPVDL